LPTVREIAQGAVLEARARPLGQALSDAEAARCLDVFQSMWREAADKGVFGRLSDYLADDDYEAEEQQRVFAAGFTITLPTEIEDEDTLETRPPRDLAMVQVVDTATAPEISLYDAHTAAWVRIDNLTLASECPLGDRYRHGFECALAARVAGSFGKPVPDTCIPFKNGLGSALSLRLSAPRVDTQPDYF
jgi:hypothetical protein